jgi:O-antigen chain-terminating methyltransferase
MTTEASPEASDPAAVQQRRDLRDRAERLWPVTVHRVPHRPPGVRAAATAPVKALLRPLLRWYVAPIVDAQREFNDVTLKLIDDLYRQLDVRFDDRLVEELEERVLRLERLRRMAPTAPAATAAAAASAPVPAAPVELDYFAFEARMRGSRDDVRRRQLVYVDDFRRAAPVLDIGCGRGEFLGLLRDAGIDAAGVDSDPDMVEICRSDGLAVEHGDALSHLAALEDESLGGVFAAQLVEHFPPAPLVHLLETVAAKLRPGGVFVAETLNPLTLSALKNYFADLTHSQPLVPDTLVLLARQAGFGSTELRFVNEPPPEERLRPVELPADAAFDDARVALAANVARLNEVLFGPQDYALVARR